jgi:hypothetical protein
MMQTWCDFCGRRLQAFAWNERTCFRCEKDGAPNQSKLQWGAYRRALLHFLREQGRRRKANKVAGVAHRGARTPASGEARSRPER